MGEGLDGFGFGFASSWHAAKPSAARRQAQARGAAAAAASEQPAPECGRLAASLGTLLARPKEEAEVPRAFPNLPPGAPACSGGGVLHLAKAAVPTLRFALPPADLLDWLPEGVRQPQGLALQQDALLPTLATPSAPPAAPNTRDG